MGKKNKKGKKSAPRGNPKTPENSKPEKNVNPFELRINHQRYNILGRKSKNDKGMPGISRNRAIKKRKEFMLVSKTLTSKSNRFIDKRIGEYDKSIPKEELIAARLIYERRKKLKKNIYNLNDDDDEELTHLGKPLSMMETLDNPLSDSDDEEDKLDANFVEEAHFGGFLTKKNSEEPSKTHKEIIGDLILESKRKKEEKKLEREKNLDLTDKLDEEFKKVMSELGGLKHENKSTDTKNDQYDMIVQELKFEPRGAPANKLKTPEDIAREEKEKIKKLEENRLLRMQDLTEAKHISDQHMSADSIYDGLELEDDFSIPPDSDAAEMSQHVKESDESTGDSDSENSQDGDDDEDVYSDLDSGSEDENDVEMEGKDKAELKDENEPPSTVISTQTLPQKIKCVENLEEFLELISAHSDEVSVIVERMIKCNHPSLGDGNRTKMESLFKTLLDYIDHICTDSSIDCSRIVNSLVPHLYSLAEISPTNCASIFRDALSKKYELLKKQRRSAACKKYFPHISSLMLLKLCGILYSTSDFRHPVVIIAMLFMSEVLSHRFLITYENLISRLFITNLYCEYVSLAKRYVPEAINFLETIIFCASVKSKQSSSKFCRSSCRGNQNLLLVTSTEECEPQKISLQLYSDTPIQGSDKLKLSLVHNAVKVLEYYVDLYSAVPSFPEIFSSVHSLLRNLPVEFYPASLKQSVVELDGKVVELMTQNRSYVVFPQKKPKPLKLFEPDFELNFCHRKDTVAKQKKRVKELTQKCKKEEKGVIREYRRDAQFLAQQQLRERMERDEERRNKVKKLFHDIAAQQGEIKKFK